MSRKGRIRLLEKVGRGAYATVWSAHHGGLDRTVAVKRVSARRMAERSHTDAHLAREAWIGSCLRSPHAVRVFAHARRRDASYLVMEWLDGETLEERLRRRGPLALEDVEIVVRQVASLLAEAHGLGIVHRDIKPANLMVMGGAGRPFVKVLDFGIAGLRAESATEAPSRVLGSPLYMSPERFAGTAELDPRADLWSLAVVAYRCLTGVHPFGGKTLPDVAVAVHDGDAVPPSRHRPTLPASIDVWFARAFARDVVCRFQTPASFAASFARAAVVDDEPTSIAIEVDWAAIEPAPDDLEQTHRLASFEGPRPVSGVTTRPSAPRPSTTPLATVA